MEILVREINQVFLPLTLLQKKKKKKMKSNYYRPSRSPLSLKMFDLKMSLNKDL